MFLTVMYWLKALDYHLINASKYKCLKCGAKKGWKYVCDCSQPYCLDCVIQHITEVMNQPITSNDPYNQFKIKCIHPDCSSQINVSAYINESTFNQLHQQHECLSPQCHNIGTRYQSLSKCDHRICEQHLNDFISTYSTKWKALPHYDYIPDEISKHDLMLRCRFPDCKELVPTELIDGRRFKLNGTCQKNNCSGVGYTYRCTKACSKYVCKQCVIADIRKTIESGNLDIKTYQSTYLRCSAVETTQIKRSNSKRIKISPCSGNLPISRYLTEAEFNEMIASYLCVNCHANYGYKFNCACGVRYCDTCLMTYLDNWLEFMESGIMQYDSVLPCLTVGCPDKFVISSCLSVAQFRKIYHKHACYLCDGERILNPSCQCGIKYCHTCIQSYLLSNFRKPLINMEGLSQVENLFSQQISPYELYVNCPSGDCESKIYLIQYLADESLLTLAESFKCVNCGVGNGMYYSCRCHGQYCNECVLVHFKQYIDTIYIDSNATLPKRTNMSRIVAKSAVNRKQKYQFGGSSPILGSYKDMMMPCLNSLVCADNQIKVSDYISREIFDEVMDKFLCQICFTNYDNIYTCNCNVKYCRTCVRRHASDFMNQDFTAREPLSRYFLKCLTPTCQNPRGIIMSKYFKPSEYQTAYQKHYIFDFTPYFKSFRCPKPGCNSGINSVAGVCLKCGSSICKHCLEIKKKDHKCDPEIVSNIRVAFQKGGNNFELPNNCPSCKMIIFKNQGCPHMTCRCGHSFTWSSKHIGQPKYK